MAVVSKNKILFSNKQYLISAAVGIFLLAASLIVNYFAGIYATRIASNSVTDLLLDNLPVFDIDGLFVYGAISLVVFLVIIVWRKLEYFPFVVKSVALLVFIRSIFVIFTHLGPVPNGILLPPHNPIRWFTFGGDLFFSGHTALPFLLALIFWNEKVVRYIFLAASIFFGATVLLGHFHYSIDVFAAFFIAYGIADLAKKFFAKEYALIRQFRPIAIVDKSKTDFY
ncbi:MAG: phosphatase PAP2-related protein [Candidatus Parcubacteria bacterium]|nr:phosphatase PAP2-related protein [Candidatus Parcubacteria bacterium]